jgi:GntR family transcriptional regulator/MocR family aminotransferase
MTKTVSPPELALSGGPPERGITRWLHGQLLEAIVAGRLPQGTRLPATRDFARLHGIARGTVVAVFERLQEEGYLCSRVGLGTWVNHTPVALPGSQAPRIVPRFARRIIAGYARPKAFRDLTLAVPERPFQMGGPSLAEFPARLWGRIAARRARGMSSWLKESDDGRGYRPLRQAIAQHLGLTRGIRCEPDQVCIVSGTQQALDLLSRLLLRPGDPVWMEDPGYFGAAIALDHAGARIIPVPVDEEGLSVAAGIRRHPRPRGIYLTPAHQFPLGVAMSGQRRREVLTLAARTGAFILEDDYDSDFRFEGRPLAALQSLDRSSTVILLGTFSKTLFPALRLGYVVTPACLADYLVAFLRRTQLCSLHHEQAVLCDFIAEGHFGRHVRRMRDLYASRLACLMDAAGSRLGGLLDIAPVKAGLYTAGHLRNGMTSRQAEQAAAASDIVALALDRYTHRAPDPGGLLLGFAAFDESAIRQGIVRLARALEHRGGL